MTEAEEVAVGLKHGPYRVMSCPAKVKNLSWGDVQKYLPNYIRLLIRQWALPSSDKDREGKEKDQEAIDIHFALKQIT